MKLKKLQALRNIKTYEGKSKEFFQKSKEIYIDKFLCICSSFHCVKFWQFFENFFWAYWKFFKFFQKFIFPPKISFPPKSFPAFPSYFSMLINICCNKSIHWIQFFSTHVSRFPQNCFSTHVSRFPLNFLPFSIFWRRFSFKKK